MLNLFTEKSKKLTTTIMPFHGINIKDPHIIDIPDWLFQPYY